MNHHHYEGVVTNLKCEISTSRTKNFNLVTFIDTPGLVDGNMTYPFDVNATIDWLGKYSISVPFYLYYLYLTISLSLSLPFFITILLLSIFLYLFISLSPVYFSLYQTISSLCSILFISISLLTVDASIESNIEFV